MPTQYAAASHMRQARDEPYRSQPKISRGELARRVADRLHLRVRGGIVRADDAARCFADDPPVFHHHCAIRLIPAARRFVAQLHRTARELALNGATRQGKQRRGRQRKPAPPCDQARESAQMVRAQLQA